mgnify:CR=1 FL=1
MDELLVKLKTKYPDLTLSRVHLGRVVRDINITLNKHDYDIFQKQDIKNLL